MTMGNQALVNTLSIMPLLVSSSIAPFLPQTQPMSREHINAVKGLDMLAQ